MNVKRVIEKNRDFDIEVRQEILGWIGHTAVAIYIKEQKNATVGVRRGDKEIATRVMDWKPEARVREIPV